MPEAFVAEMEKARHAEALSEFGAVIGRIEAATKRRILNIGLNGDFTIEPTEVVAEMDGDAELIDADRASYVTELAGLIKKYKGWIPAEYRHRPASGTLSDKI